MSHIKKLMVRLLVASALLLMGNSLFAVETSKYNMSSGVTPISSQIYGIHMMMFWVCCGIALLVFGFLFFSVFKYRRSKGAVAAKFHGNNKLEVIWTIIPFLILIALAIPATKVMVNINDTSNAELTIKITGYQWYWKYEYLDNGVAYFSKLSTPQAQINNQQLKGKNYLLEVDNPLVIPINRKVRFLITSNDVIHSWWVPHLGIKKDAVPGFIHEMWANVQEPGTYLGQCAELCGAQHGFMPIVVEAKDEKSFDAWLAEQNKQAELVS